MPRKAITQMSDEVRSAIMEIRRHYEANNYSLLSFSKAAKVSQSSLFRFIKGERKTVTGTAKKCLSYIAGQHKQHNRHNDEKILNDSIPENGYSVVQNAAKALWDGDPQTAELIALMIQSLKPLVDIAVKGVQVSPKVKES